MTLFARRSVALGLSPAIVPVSLWLVVGFLLGPAALGVLTPDVLAHLDAAVSVALGTLGVFVGLALVPRARGAWLLLGAALVESGAAVAIVSTAAAFLLSAQQVPLTAPIALIAISLGAAAGASSARSFVEGQRDGDHAMHVADLDDVLPIVAAAAAAGFVGTGTVPNWIAAIAEPIAIGSACGTIGLLLFERTSGDAERAVYVLGVLALIGGACAYTGVSPLLAGLCAGVYWRNMPGRADAIIGGDLRRFQHPLVVLLIVVAGAETRIGPLPLLLLVIFVVFRLTGKVIGGVAAARLVPTLAGEVLGAHLISPGVMGIAIALNVMQIAPSDGQAVVSAVAAGALVFELVSAFVAPAEPA